MSWGLHIAAQRIAQCWAWGSMWRARWRELAAAMGGTMSAHYLAPEQTCPVCGLRFADGFQRFRDGAWRWEPRSVCNRHSVDADNRWTGERPEVQR